MFSIVILLSILLASAHAQEPARESDLPKPQKAQEEYRLGPGDSISIHAYGVKEISQTARVSNSGRIHVPYVGIISVANKTTAQVEREVVRRLEEQQLVKEPWVNIKVEEYHSQPVFVIGEFNTPGQYMITNEMYLLDIISKAGGLKTTASQEGFLYRRRDAHQPSVEVKISTDEKPSAAQGSQTSTPAGAEESNLTGVGGPASTEKAIRINFKELNETKRHELNLRLQGGDVVYVPMRQRPRYFVVGDVPWPGSRPIPQSFNGSVMTATRAVAAAGGALNSAKRKAFVMRHDQAGEVRVLEFEFAGVIKGTSTDIPIEPNDIIVVPSSQARSIGNALFLLMPRLIQQFLIF